jgi:3-oxoadipate enol-lactonase
MLKKFVVASLAIGICACGAGLPPSASTGQVDVDNGHLHYERQGDGPVVVLIHGGTMDLGIWDDMLAELVPYFRVIRYDLRGFGRSSRPTGHFAAYRDLAALLDALDVGHANLVGLSAGARIPLDFALEYPDRVDRLVLVSPTVSGYRGGSVDAPWAQALIAAIQQGDTLGAADAWLSSPAMRPTMERPELARRVRILTHANAPAQPGGSRQFQHRGNRVPAGSGALKPLPGWRRRSL